MSANGDVFWSDTATEEIYRYDYSTRTTTQLTRAQTNETYDGFAVSADGSKIAFTSSTHYSDYGTVSGPTSTGNARLHTIDIVSGLVRTVAQDVTIFSTAKFRISADGTRVLFSSSDDLTGSNGDGNEDVFSVDFRASTAAFRQLSDTTGAVSVALFGISNAGKAYFVSTGNVGGLNPSGGGNIFEYDVENSSLRKLTSYSGSQPVNGATLSSDGSSLYFFSAANYTGDNPNIYNQAFRLDLSSGEFIQTTNFDYFISYNNAQFSGDGLRLVYTYADATNHIGTIDISPEASNLDIEAGSGSSGRVVAALLALRGTLKGLGAYTLDSQDFALAALDRVTANIELLAQARGYLGAGYSRLEIAEQLAESQAIEYAAARSRIADVDVASEVAQLQRDQIIRNLGAALLAQANQQPELALDLLGS